MNETALQIAVDQQPVGVQIQVDSAFFAYNGGVLDAPLGDNPVFHDVLVVGYGTTEERVDFWLVKNSWGVGWGENGYLRMRRNDPAYMPPMGNASLPKISFIR